MRSRAEVYFLTAWQPSFQDDDDEGGDLYSMLVRTACVCLSGKMIIFATKKSLSVTRNAYLIFVNFGTPPAIEKGTRSLSVTKNDQGIFMVFQEILTFFLRFLVGFHCFSR